MLNYDLEDQQEEEQFKIEDDNGPSKSINKFLREQKQFEKLNQKKALLLNKETKHKARIVKQDVQTCYICDNCETTYKKGQGTLIYKASGEYAYCSDCMKILYPSYRQKLSTLVRKGQDK